MRGGGASHRVNALRWTGFGWGVSTTRGYLLGGGLEQKTLLPPPCCWAPRLFVKRPPPRLKGNNQLQCGGEETARYAHRMSKWGGHLFGCKVCRPFGSGRNSVRPNASIGVWSLVETARVFRKRPSKIRLISQSETWGKVSAKKCNPNGFPVRNLNEPQKFRDLE